MNQQMEKMKERMSKYDEKIKNIENDDSDKTKMKNLITEYTNKINELNQTIEANSNELT